MDVAALRLRDGHAERVLDGPGAYLFKAREQREDGQAGRVGGGPALRPQPARAQVEDRAGARVPAGAGAARVVQLIQAAAAALQHQHVPIAFRPGPLHGRVRRDRVGPRVGLAAEFGERDRQLRLARPDDGIGNPIGGIAAEVGVQVRAQPDARDVVGRTPIHGRARDVAVERTRRRKDRTPVLMWRGRAARARA